MKTLDFFGVFGMVVLMFFVYAFRNPTSNLSKMKSTELHVKSDYVNLSNATVIPQRLKLFRGELLKKGIDIRTDGELLIRYADSDQRRKLAVLVGLPESLITLHVELADLQRVGIPDQKAQLLLFSQLSKQDPFTHEVIGAGLLSRLDQLELKMSVDNLAQDIEAPSLSLEDISGFQKMAANASPILEYGNEFKFLRSNNN